MRFFWDDVQKATGALQLCAGQEAGCEAAIHAVDELFELPDIDAAILVDATNAFNSLNRENTLRNIHYLYPSFSIALINTYRENVNLFIDGHTTEGQPISHGDVCPRSSFINRLSTNAIVT